jgi:hypothetical protein
VLAAALGVALWLVVDPRTPDLAAQVYRVSLFRHEGWAVWDEHWYSGHYMPGYSLTFPPLAALLGMRTVAALSVLASAFLFERLVRGLYGEAARWGAVWFALAAVGDIWIGRLTFALGVTFAVGCVCVYVGAARERGREGDGGGLARTGAAVVLAALCAASSPVAGLLLALLAVSYWLVKRSPRAALVVGAPAAAVVGALAALFPEGGWEPYPLTSFVATVAVVLGFLLVLPARERGLRVGALVYLAACVLSVALHTPMGANVERYGVLLAAPLLLCALASSRELGERGPGEGELGERALRRDVWSGRLVSTTAVVVVLCGMGVWTMWGPVRETAAVAGDPSTSAAYYAPLQRFLATHGGRLVRVEVPFTRGHWEAAFLAPSVSLARGWEKQLDTRYDLVLLRHGLTAAGYRAWLLRQAVTYVALPDVALDPSSAQEGRLIERGLPYLREVFLSRHWRVYRVLGSQPLAQGPGWLTALGHDSFSLRARAAGSFVVRIHYTRYWTLTHGAGCVGPAPGGWTSVDVPRLGSVSVAARFSLAQALEGGGQVCRSGVQRGASA